MFRHISGVAGEPTGKGTPSPSWGRATVRLPPSKFFLFFRANFLFFFLPIPITSPIYPFFLSLRGFLFLCVYFLIHVSFRVSEGKNTGKIRIAFPILPVSMWLLYALFSFSAIFLCCVFRLFYSPCYVFVLYLVVTAVFFADLPILLPSVGLSSLLCVIIRLGVFRGSEGKNGFCVVLVWCIYEKRADETFVCPIRPMSLACYFLCRNDVVLLCGLSVLTFPVTVGVMLS